MNWKHIKPEEIEKESMRIIASELVEQGIQIPKEHQGVVYRAIHTAADFDFAKTLVFTPDAVEKGVQALQAGCPIVTDTNMALSGINKGSLYKAGCGKILLYGRPTGGTGCKRNGHYKGSGIGGCVGRKTPHRDFCGRECTHSFDSYGRTDRTKKAATSPGGGCTSRVCQCGREQRIDLEPMPKPEDTSHCSPGAQRRLYHCSSYLQCPALSGIWQGI